MSLRTQVLRGGIYLTVRQGLGLLISLGGVVLLTRLIGPSNYGLYASALGVSAYLQSLTQWGIRVYLVRMEHTDDDRIYHQAFTLLLLLGVAGTGLSILALPMLGLWVAIPGFSAVALALFLGILVTQLIQVPMAWIERRLDYRRVALIELAGQMAYFAVALPLAFYGVGAWAPVIGWWSQQVLLVVCLYWFSGYRPRLYWNRQMAGRIVDYGLSYSASLWVWQLRSLVNPLVIGRFVGAETVGYVALAIRLVEALSFVKSSTWRIAIAVLAKFQDDRPKVVKAITDGMELQILALGPLLVGFGWIAPWVLPVLFGADWSNTIDIYPYVALSYLSNAVFNMHSSALYVYRKNWQVTKFHLWHIALFGGAATLLATRFGIVAYGWAEMIAVASYLSIHISLVRGIGRPTYRLAGPWWVAFALALFTPQLQWWSCVGLLAVAAWPATWAKIRELFGSLWRLRHV